MPYRKVKESESGCSVASDSLTPWTVAHQASPSMGFSRQEYWSGLLFPSPGDLPDPGIELAAPALQVDYLLLSHQGSPSEAKKPKFTPFHHLKFPSLQIFIFYLFFM